MHMEKYKKSMVKHIYQMHVYIFQLSKKKKKLLTLHGHTSTWAEEQTSDLLHEN